MASKPNPLLDAVAEDHQMMYTCYDEYLKNAGDVNAQGRWTNQLIWEVARHTVAEELVVYPLLEQHLGAEGKRRADQNREDRQQVKEMLYRVEPLSPKAAMHGMLLKSVMEHLRPHNERVEQTDLPMLGQAMSEGDTAAAAVRFKHEKELAPTRMHPVVFNKPPFESIALLMAPVDKFKDVFTQFPSDEARAAARD